MPTSVEGMELGIGRDADFDISVSELHGKAVYGSLQCKEDV